MAILGIDLGTTNSLSAIVENGVPKILKTYEGESLLPSALSLENGEIKLGYTARKNRLLHPEFTISSVKRFLGKKYSELGEEKKFLPFKVSEGAEDTIEIHLGERKINAIEASSQVLLSLKKSAEQLLNHPVTEAVITVPAYFNDSQRQATRLAGRLAGLDVLRIINEPTAAALAYGLHTKKNGIIAVYDLGGGTFDLSILKCEDGIFEVLSTSGNTALGGDDFDKALISYILPDIETFFNFTLQSKQNETQDSNEQLLFISKLNEEAERVKKLFSDGTIQNVDFKMEWCVKHFEKKITREVFNALVKPLLLKTKINCEQALKDANLQLSEITDVILVGGPTRLPLVKEVVAEFFQKTPNTSMNPDEVVALGAAIQADILAGNNKELLLIDVVPLSLGIETYGNLCSVIIPRNSKVPARALETFTTYVDNQTGVEIHILQGEREKASENRTLGRFKLSPIKPAPAGFPRIEVRFLMDADGILQVSAKDKATGKEQQIEMRSNTGLSDHQITEMIKSAEENALKDYEFKKWIEVKNSVEPILRMTEDRLREVEQDLDKEYVKELKSLCSRLHIAIENKDAESSQNLKYEINLKTVKLAEVSLLKALNKH